MTSDNYGALGSADIVLQLKDVAADKRSAVVAVQKDKSDKLRAALFFANRFKHANFRIRVLPVGAAQTAN